MDSLRSTIASWIAPTQTVMPLKEEPKDDIKQDNIEIEQPKVEMEQPKEASLADKADAAMEKVQTFVKVFGLGLLGIAALYSSLDKGTKMKAGRLGASLEAVGNLTKFLLNKDIKAGSEGINTVYKLYNKQIPTGKIYHV